MFVPLPQMTMMTWIGSVDRQLQWMMMMILSMDCLGYWKCYHYLHYHFLLAAAAARDHLSPSFPPPWDCCTVTNRLLVPPLLLHHHYHHLHPLQQSPSVLHHCCRCYWTTKRRRHTAKIDSAPLVPCHSACPLSPGRSAAE